MNILIIDDEPVFREGIKAVLTRSADLNLIGEAASARDGFALLDQRAPDVVLMDLLLPGMDGVSAAREVRRRCPTAKILMLSGRYSARDVLEARAAGALGYAAKTEPLEALLEAIRRVARGERYFAPCIDQRAVSGRTIISDGQGEPDVLSPLSTREREVFALAVRGFSNQRIARELCVSYKTVDTHRRRIYEKLGCHSSSDLVRFAALNGLLRDLRTPPPAPELESPAVAASEMH